MTETPATHRPTDDPGEPIDLLVQADYLYPMTAGEPIHGPGEVAIRGERIVYCGPPKTAGHWCAHRTITGAGRAVLPGLINTHTHAASLVFRSQTDEHSTGRALYTVAFPMEREIGTEEWHTLARLGCCDLLRSGVTTLNDIWYAPEGLAQAVADSGLRAQIAAKVFDVRLEALQHGDYTRYPAEGEARMAAAIAFAERWHNAADGRIQARLGTHASDTCAPALHRQARREAERLGIGLHLHAAQSAQEVNHIRATHGCGPLEYLRDIGWLGTDSVVAHLTHADDTDLDAVAASGAGYAHCPTIYPRRGVYPRLLEILACGIPTGFATDWMQNDPFEAMRNALHAVRLQQGNPEALASRAVLRHFTRDAARVLGLGERIGTLEPGKQADLIVLDLERPHLQPFYGDYPALVFYARASDVVTSVIAGTVVLEDGQPTRIDEQRIVREVNTHLPRWREQLRRLGSRSVVDCCPGG